ncbi:flavin reductase family protein [Agrococcus sp. ARC_14]|uniref:flavin reductase family protein n=1 Tax=Agrococcus sp. ARC_14 TaxID=2919927 RepID=UPI001F063A94|nr:flavin reductase family protein [Agrococcus sp. ARC_14]MCH1881343.1 flavin reductase family protein [Agrococcus sp. ARC_14]
MGADSHAVIDASELSASEAYRLLTGVIVPRPIAWITSRSADGVLNLAPFSAFTLVANDPPMVGVNIGLRAGTPKDTAANIEATGEYVIHIPSWSMQHAVHESSEVHPPHVDEAEHLGLATVPSDVVGVPRLRDAPIALECRLDRVVSFGRAGARFTVGEVLRFHIRADLLVDGKIDTVALDPVARIAGPTYARVGETERLRPIVMAITNAPTHG